MFTSHVPATILPVGWGGGYICTPNGSPWESGQDQMVFWPQIVSFLQKLDLKYVFFMFVLAQTVVQILIYLSEGPIKLIQPLSLPPSSPINDKIDSRDQTKACHRCCCFVSPPLFFSPMRWTIDYTFNKHSYNLRPIIVFSPSTAIHQTIMNLPAAVP